MPQEINQTKDEAPGFVITRADGKIEVPGERKPNDALIGFIVLGGIGVLIVWLLKKL